MLKNVDYNLDEFNQFLEDQNNISYKKIIK